MCLLWVIVYVLAVAGMLRTNRPTISPYFPAFVLPYEIAVLTELITQELRFNYVFAAYICFCALELAIVYLLFFRIKYFKLASAIAYLAAIAAQTVLYSAVLFDLENIRLYASFAVTIVGNFLWLILLCRGGIEHSHLNLAAAVAKLAGDQCAWVVYHSQDGIRLKILAYALVAIDIVYLAVYILGDHKTSEINNKRNE